MSKTETSGTGTTWADAAPQTWAEITNRATWTDLLDEPADDDASKDD